MQSTNRLETQLTVTGAQTTKQQLDQVAGAFANVGKAADKANTNFTTAFIGTAGAAGAIRVIGTLTKAYGDLVNVTATAEQVFGDDGFALIAESAENAAQAFGVSKRAFIEGTTLLAGLGKQSGLAGKQLAEFSIGLTEIATDLGAAFNTNTADAIAAIQSGFSGSSIEPLRRYNIVINDTALKQEYLALTGEKVTATLSNQQRQLAFVSLLTKQSADYTGQWDREQNQLLATQQKFNAELENFQSNLGSGIAPALRDATAFATDMLEVFNNLPASVQGVVGSLTGAVAAWVAMRGALAAADYGAQRAGGRIEEMSQRIMPVATKAAGGFAVAIAAYSVIAAKAAADQERFNEAMEALGDARSLSTARDLLRDIEQTDTRSTWSQIGDGLKAMLPWAQDSKEGVEELLFGNKELLDKLREYGDPDVTNAVLELTKTHSDLTEGTGLTTASTEELIALRDEQIRSAANAANASDDLAESLAAEQFALATSSEKVEIAAGSYEDLGDAIGEVSDRAADARDNVNDLIDAAFESVNRRFDSAIALQEAIEGIEELAKLRASGETTARDLLEEQQSIQEAISDTVAGRVADAEAFYGELSAGAEIGLTRQIFDDLRNELGPEATEFIDALEAEFEKNVPKMKVDVGIADADLGAQVRAVVDQQTAQGREQILVDVLAEYGGLDGDAIADVLSRIPADKRKLVLTTALDTAEAEGKLGDEEYVASLIVDASFDEAYDSLEDFTNDPLVNDINAIIKANLTAAEADMREFRRLNGTLDVKVRLVGNQGDTFRPGGGNSMQPTNADGVQPFGAEPMAASSVGLSAPIMVTARRPVAGNTFVTINPPPGVKYDEVMASVDKWRRRNGSTQGPWQ